MKKITLTLILALFFVSGVVAQQNPADAPATKEEIQRYLEVTRSLEMVKQIFDVMAKSIRDITHDRIAKEHSALPPGAEERMKEKTDEMLKNMPIDEMFDVMISVYQKHWTKGDVDSRVLFHSDRQESVGRNAADHGRVNAGYAASHAKAYRLNEAER